VYSDEQLYTLLYTSLYTHDFAFIYRETQRVGVEVHSFSQILFFAETSEGFSSTKAQKLQIHKHLPYKPNKRFTTSKQAVFNS